MKTTQRLAALLILAALAFACAPTPEITPEPQGQRASVPGFHPLDVEALRNGRVWVPGVNVSQAGQSVIWDSLQGGDAWSSSSIPIPLETAANGKKYWDVSAQWAAWMIAAPSTPLEDEVQNYSWAGWFKAKSQPTSASHVFWARWPEQCDNNRDYVWVHADWGDVSYEFSWDGTGADVGDCGVTGDGDRGKGNVSAVDFSRWVFVRMTVRYVATPWHAAGANYVRNGGQFTTIATVHFNEEPQEGTGWSAPHDGNNNPSADGPMRGEHVYGSTAAQWLAARGYGQQGPWLVGPQYFARGDAGPDEVWRRVMEYETPQD